MPPYSRTIHITADNLGGTKSAIVLLTFDEQPDIKGMYKDYYPVVWKATEFHPEGSYALTAKFKSQLVFINPQVEDNTIASAATWTKINTGQKTELIEKPNSATRAFTSPSAGEANMIKAINQTSTSQTIGVGFDKDSFPPTTLLVFKKVGATHSVTAHFTPIVRAYVVSDYKEKSVLTEAVREPVIWTVNLATLEPTTWWTLEHDSASGVYSIIPSHPSPSFPK